MQSYLSHHLVLLITSMLLLAGCGQPQAEDSGPTRTPGPTATLTETPTTTPTVTPTPTLAPTPAPATETPTPTDIPEFTEMEAAYRDEIVPLANKLFDTLRNMAELAGELARNRSIVDNPGWRLQVEDDAMSISALADNVNGISPPSRFRGLHNTATRVFISCDRAAVNYVDSWDSGIIETRLEQSVGELNACATSLDELLVDLEEDGLIK